MAIIYTVYMKVQNRLTHGHDTQPTKFYLDESLMAATEGRIIEKSAYKTESAEVARYVVKVLNKARKAENVVYGFECITGRDNQDIPHEYRKDNEFLTLLVDTLQAEIDIVNTHDDRISQINGHDLLRLRELQGRIKDNNMMLDFFAKIHV